jgi:hypothetical protein
MADENTRRKDGENELQHRAISAAIAEGILKKIQDATKRGDPRVIGCLLAMQRRAMASLNSLTVLIEHATHDCYHDAASILRGLYDVHLQVLYLMTKPVEHAALYADHVDVQNHRVLKTILRNNSDLCKDIRDHPERHTFETNVVHRFKRVEARFLIKDKKRKRCRTNWYEGDLSTLATALGYLSEYELIQMHLSQSVHSTPYGLQFGAVVDNSILMNYAWAFNFRIIGAVADYLGVQLTDHEKIVIRIARHNLNDRPSPNFGQP